MKKILGISMVAMLAVTPMMAMAADLPDVATATHATENVVASTKYVQGAYNQLVEAINSDRDAINDKQDQLMNDADTPGEIGETVHTTVAAAGTASDTNLVTEKAVRDAIDSAVESGVTGMVTLTGVQTLTNKTIDADSNNLSNLESDNFKTGVIQTTVRDSANATDTNLVSEKAVRSAVDTATTGMVTLTGTQTLTNKTIDADNNNLSNLEADNFKTGVITQTIAADGSTDNNKLASETAVRSAVDSAISGINTSLGTDYAKKTGVTNTISNSTVTVATTWGNDATVATVAALTGAAYSEPAPAKQGNN